MPGFTELLCPTTSRALSPAHQREREAEAEHAAAELTAGLGAIWPIAGLPRHRIA